MKNLWFVASVVVVGWLAGGTGVAAPNALQPLMTSQSHFTYLANAPADEQAQTFVGQIAQQDGKYVLVDGQTKSTYLLDDQDKAKQFDGQQVKVTGSLDKKTNTIRVSDIQPA